MKSFVVTIAFALGCVSSASALTSQNYKCAEGKAKAWGKFESCVNKVVAKFYKTGSMSDLRRCRTKYAAAWTKLQQSLPNAPACQLPRLTDQGATVKDNFTALVWEKKTTEPLSGENPADPHDVDNLYTYWISEPGAPRPNGTAFTVFLAELNGTGFGGSNGWRIPTIAELLTLPLIEESCPPDCHLDPLYGSFSIFDSYLSSTESLYAPDFPEVDQTIAYMNWVATNGAIMYHDGKSAGLYVRAVHGGL
ncbi:MAG TPA: DUF1566 domain-containing protein [Terriglobales bacterium]|nr:DUF1566 domain-containing protein [Terriglobales bacterium]